MLRIEERADGEKNGCLSGGGAGGQWGAGGSLLAATLPYLLAPRMSPHSLTQSLSCV